jgi:hypothetical protein
MNEIRFYQIQLKLCVVHTEGEKTFLKKTLGSRPKLWSVGLPAEAQVFFFRPKLQLCCEISCCSSDVSWRRVKQHLSNVLWNSCQ